MALSSVEARLAGSYILRMKREKREDPQAVIEAATSAREVTPFDKGAIALLAFGMLPLVVGWIFLFRRDFDMGEFIGINVLTVFVFAVVETFSIFFLWGLGRLDLPAKLVHWLGGATVGEVAGMLILIINSIFGD